MRRTARALGQVPDATRRTNHRSDSTSSNITGISLQIEGAYAADLQAIETFANWQIAFGPSTARKEKM
jgi:hypothetical protein